MKILIICPDWFPNISGFGTSCYEFASKAKKEHKITILTPSQKGLEKKGLNVRAVPQVMSVLGRNPLVLGLLREIKRADYDVILLYSYMFEMNARVAMYRKLGIIKKPVILMYRGSLEDDVLMHLNLPTRIAKKTYDRTLGSAVFKYSDFIISNSKPTLEVIRSKYAIPEGKMQYIPNSVNVREYKISSLSNKRILFNGRLIENKGIKFFDKIAQSIPPDWKFTIVGSGPMQSYVEELRKKHKNIDFRGKIPKSEVVKILSKTDVLILPTFAEGSPRVVLEAAASGVPSVAFDVGDVSTILDKNKNGFAIKKYDINDFTRKMKMLIANAPLRKTKGAAARKYAEKHLDWELIYGRMISKIEEVSARDRKFRDRHRLILN